MDNEKLIEILKQDRADLYADLEAKSDELKAAYSEINTLKDRIAKLTGENEAYRAMIDTYQRKETEK